MGNLVGLDRLLEIPAAREHLAANLMLDRQRRRRMAFGIIRKDDFLIGRIGIERPTGAAAGGDGSYDIIRMFVPMDRFMMMMVSYIVAAGT